MKPDQLANYTKQDFHCHVSWSKSNWRYGQGSLHQLQLYGPSRNPLYFQLMQ